MDADLASRVIAAAADIALVVNREGIIQDVSIGADDFPRQAEGWINSPWVATVTVESRSKVDAMLKDAAEGVAPRWRQVNHSTPDGPDIPILYATLPLGADGRIIAIGRDMRAVAGLQQRLVNAQQSMEREYARIRQAETRYRLLFQVASEAVLIIDAASFKIEEANPAAREIMGLPEKRIIGRSVKDIASPESAPALDGLLGKARATGMADGITLRLREAGRDVSVAASLFRQGNASHVLLRLTATHPDDAIVLPKDKSKLLSVIERLPEAFVVTDLECRVLTANSAFLELAQLGTEEQAHAQALDRWLGRSGVDLEVLIVNLREHGSIRNFATVLRGEYGSSEDVEVSAVAVPDSKVPCYGFTIRSHGKRSRIELHQRRTIEPSMEHLSNLVGRVSLKDLVREATDVIERLCIEAALEQTKDNRASAAEMLGLSRQSLYAKLRRYGLGDLDPGAEDA